MRNLRKFNTRADYESATLIYPAVSWIVEGNTVAFDPEAPVVFGGLTVYYDIEDPSVEIDLFNGGGDSSSSSDSGSGSGSGSGGVLPSKMIVDGVEETPINTWRFETAGEHIVQYEFADNQIPENFMNGGDKFPHLVGVEIGDAITSIGSNAFEANSHLTSATIGNGVTSIGDNAFNGCSSLTSITVEATTPPTLGSYPFGNTNNCPIYVPSSAVDEYKISTSTGWYEYASRIQAKS